MCVISSTFILNEEVSRSNALVSNPTTARPRSVLPPISPRTVQIDRCGQDSHNCTQPPSTRSGKYTGICMRTSTRESCSEPYVYDGTGISPYRTGILCVPYPCLVTKMRGNQVTTGAVAMGCLLLLVLMCSNSRNKHILH